jgi:hypothetical protein
LTIVEIFIGEPVESGTFEPATFCTATDKFMVLLSIQQVGYICSPCVFSTLTIFPKASKMIAVIGSTEKIEQQ